MNEKLLEQKAIEFEKNWFDKDITISDLLVKFATEVTKELQEQNEFLSKHILELQADKGRLTDENRQAKELLKQWSQISNTGWCDNINLVTDTEAFLKE